MQKMVALVALRCLPRGGVHFRTWFARKVVDMARSAQTSEARVFHQHECMPSAVHYTKMSQLRLDLSMTVARYNHRQNYALHQHLKRNVWFNYWGWHEKYDYAPPKLQKRL